VLPGCGDETHHPGPLLQGKQVGTWQLERRNGQGGPIPAAFERFELRSTADEPLADGILLDAEGRAHEYRMLATVDSFFGPWLLLKSSQTGVGWQDRICLGCVAPSAEPEDFELVVAFERHRDGSFYPHRYERVP